jgi:RNA polymerase sigma factor (sigma-70 family)
MYNRRGPGSGGTMVHQQSREEFVEAAVGEYEKRLVGYAFQVTRDLERARDVVQETFIRLCRADIPRIKDYLAPWLYRVCRNLSLDVRRKESRMSHLTDVQTESSVSDCPTPSEVVEDRERAATVFKMLSSLPPNQQEAIRLKFREGLKYREIAQVMDVSISNVGFLIHKGMNAVKEKFASPRTGLGEGGVV